MTEVADVASLDLTRWITPGSRVMWTNGYAEPLTLIEKLIEQRAAIGGARVFLTVSYNTILQPEHADHLTFDGLGALGANARLAQAGVLNAHPMHLSHLCRSLHTGQFPVDVAFVQLAGPDASGQYSPGLNHSFTHDLIDRARVVIAEVDTTIPAMSGIRPIHSHELDVLIHSVRPSPTTRPTPPPDDTDQCIARAVRDLVPDGATLQVGIGMLPSTLLPMLHQHRNLGIHTGMLNDPVFELIASGAVTNVHKPADRGYSTASTIYPGAFPTEQLREIPLKLRPSRHVLDQSVLSRLPRFTAINSALEIDLTGQVNAEQIDGRPLGAVGGLVDFTRGARAAEGGRSITAIRSQTSRGRSRIVPQLSGGTVTLPRSDVDVVVTEWGTAHIADANLDQRARQLIGIAHPDHRDDLTKAARADGLTV